MRLSDQVVWFGQAKLTHGSKECSKEPGHQRPAKLCWQEVRDTASLIDRLFPEVLGEHPGPAAAAQGYRTRACLTDLTGNVDGAVADPNHQYSHADHVHGILGAHVGGRVKSSALETAGRQGMGVGRIPMVTISYNQSVKMFFGVRFGRSVKERKTVGIRHWHTL